MYRSILVPLDGSTFSEAALRPAVEVARASRASLHLVHSPFRFEPTAGELPPLTDVPLLDEAADEYLRRKADALALEEGVPVSYALLEPPVLEAIRDYTVAQRIDLIAMATHGRGGFSRLWLGSVAEGVVRSATVPVLLVRPRRSGVARRGPFPRHVLVPLDGTPGAERMIEPVLPLVRASGAALTLLRSVAPAYFMGSTVAVTSVELDREEVERRRDEAEAYLAGVAGRLRMRGVDAATRVVLSADPVLAILEARTAAGADLIAMATHARRGLARALLGSVADKVLRSVRVPVLLLRITDAEEAVLEEQGRSASRESALRPHAHLVRP